MLHLTFLLPLLALADPAAPSKPAVIVVVGAEGTAEYGREFAVWADRWQSAAKSGGIACTVIGRRSSDTSDREVLQKALETELQQPTGELWLVLIGHGTFDGKLGRFNLRGPDVSATELAEWLKPAQRPLAVINCASASGAFMSPLAAPGRVVITATKNGHENNYCRFGNYLSAAIADPASDLDKDGQTSLLEAYLLASRQTAEFYASDARLATEHALLDDTGDGLGTPTDWFRGVRAIRTAKDGAPHDGARAQQFTLLASVADRGLSAERRTRRNELELAVATLREAKAKLTEEEYYSRLETLLVELARLYEPPAKNP